MFSMKTTCNISKHDELEATEPLEHLATCSCPQLTDFSIIIKYRKWHSLVSVLPHPVITSSSPRCLLRSVWSKGRQIGLTNSATREYINCYCCFSAYPSPVDLCVVAQIGSPSLCNHTKINKGQYQNHTSFHGKQWAAVRNHDQAARQQREIAMRHTSVEGCTFPNAISSLKFKYINTLIPLDCSHFYTFYYLIMTLIMNFIRISVFAI
jgi:hypothetical protein